MTLRPLVEMLGEGSKPLRSRLKNPKVEALKMVIASTVAEEENRKEIKATLPTLFTGEQKETKKFILEVQLYITLNLKAFKTDKLKELFMLSYVQGGPAQFWKADKANTILAEMDLTKILK
ncbi:hypothetical protein Moror_4835 [Moniliophthora roreri MCA 2997]|uniref:Uncharacterized protein n=2 Tax=Moniliophthora roreri TaxID=221103 RepID=V2WPN7_MONRO|nr:hypothetical protein Moror_4835 [Moniliophthora roreri MCA 2997]